MNGLHLADVIAEGKNTTKSLARVDKWGGLQADLTHRKTGFGWTTVRTERCDG